jgi:hypothetical protein
MHKWIGILLFFNSLLASAAESAHEQLQLPQGDLEQLVLYDGEIPADSDPLFRTSVFLKSYFVMPEKTEAENSEPDLSKLTFLARKEFTCSGVLIHERVILTAAHCVVRDGIKTKDVKVHIKFQSGSDWSRIADVDRVEVHPKYEFAKVGPFLTSETVKYDLALIKLKNSFRHPKILNVSPMVLEPIFKEDLIYSGSLGGFGKKDEADENLGFFRQQEQVSFSVVTTQNKLMLLSLADLAHGDSGSGLFVKNPKNPKVRNLVGILSTIGKMHGERFGLYEYLANHSYWIKKTLKQILK